MNVLDFYNLLLFFPKRAIDKDVEGAFGPRLNLWAAPNKKRLKKRRLPLFFLL